MRTRTTLALATPLALCAAAAAAGTDDTAMQRMQSEIEALKQANERQSQEIQALRDQNGEQWLSEQRASQIRGVVADVLSDADTRTSLQSDFATAGYDKSFFIASPDGKFRLNIKGQIQARFAYNNVNSTATNNGPDQAQNLYGFELRRVKLTFAGHVIDPSWQYEVKVAFERNGGSSTPGANGQVQLEDVFVQKDFGNGIFFRMGQWKNWFNYEEFTSSSSQQLVDRSIVNQYFSTKFVQGIVLGVQQEWWRTWASYNDGGGNRSIQVVQNANLTEWALTGRLEFLLAGNWNAFKDMQGWIGSDFGASIGAAVNWQRGTGVQGQRNTISNGSLPGMAAGTGEQVSMLTWTADLNLRGSGWSVFGAVLGNTAYAFTPTATLTDDPNSIGVVVQGGLFLTDNLELVARYEGLWVTDGVAGATTANALNNQTLNVVTLGANWYFARNSLKFSTDVGYAFNPIKYSNGLFGEGISGADYRTTMSAAGVGNHEFVIRAQMQLLF
jgi:hypothetical protein